MGDNFHALFVHKDVYYFNKHVPKDIRSYYKRDRDGYMPKDKIQFADHVPVFVIGLRIIDVIEIIHVKYPS